MILDVYSRLSCFYRMRSEGFPFIAWGFGAGSLFASSGSSGRRRVVVGLSLIPCLWGKLQNLSFSKVSKEVVMLFCVAGVALCHIPTCLITCRKCQNWRMSRTKCSFCCADVSRFESLVFPCLVSSFWEMFYAHFIVQNSIRTCLVQAL